MTIKAGLMPGFFVLGARTEPAAVAAVVKRGGPAGRSFRRARGAGPQGSLRRAETWSGVTGAASFPQLARM